MIINHDRRRSKREYLWAKDFRWTSIGGCRGPSKQRLRPLSPSPRAARVSSHPGRYVRVPPRASSGTSRGLTAEIFELSSGCSCPTGLLKYSRNLYNRSESGASTGTGGRSEDGGGKAEAAEASALLENAGDYALGKFSGLNPRGDLPQYGGRGTARSRPWLPETIHEVLEFYQKPYSLNLIPRPRHIVSQNFPQDFL